MIVGNLYKYHIVDIFKILEEVFNCLTAYQLDFSES
jgi:hypothetical protein